MLVAALGLYVVSLLGFAVVRGLPGLMAVRALEGLAVGAIIPAVMAIVAAGVPTERRGRAMGQMMGLGGIGFLIGPVLGERLARFGLAWPFLAAAALAGLALVAAGVAARRGAFGAGAWQGEAPNPASAEAPSALLKTELAALAERLAAPAFWGLLLPLIAIKVNFSTLQAGLPLYGGHVLGLSPAVISGLFVLTAAAYALVTPIAGRLSDRFPSRALAHGCLLLLAVLALALAPIGQPGLFFAIFGGFALVQSAGYMLTTKYLADGLGQGAQGRGLGLASALGDLGMIIGPPCLLGLYAWQPWALFTGMAAVALAAVAGARFLRPRAAEPALTAPQAPTHTAEQAA